MNSKFLGHDDDGNSVWLICIINWRDPDASEWFIHTEVNY